MPKWLQDLWSVISDGISYDLAKLALGSLVVAIAGAAIGKFTNKLESLKEAIYTGIAIFVATIFLVSMISPRTQTPQLGGTIEYAIAGPLGDTGSTITVFTVDVINSGTMQSIVKNWSVSATINSLNYQGSFLIPPPPSFTFNDAAAAQGAPKSITYHGSDSLLDKSTAPIPAGGETKGLLFIVFNGIDANIFKTGADNTISFEDALSKSYTLRVTSSAVKGRIEMSSGIHAELMCPVNPQTSPQPNLSVGIPPKI